MPRGGRREGAGRKPKPKVVLQADVAREVLGDIPQKEVWKSLVADKSTRLPTMQYLTDRAYGKVPLGIGIGVFDQTPGSEDQPLITINFVSTEFAGGAAHVSNEKGDVAHFEGGKLLYVQHGSQVPIFDKQLPDETPLHHGEVPVYDSEPVEELVPVSAAPEILPPASRTLPAPEPTPFEIERRKKMMPRALWPKEWR